MGETEVGTDVMGLTKDVTRNDFKESCVVCPDVLDPHLSVIEVSLLDEDNLLLSVVLLRKVHRGVCQGRHKSG